MMETRLERDNAGRFLPGHKQASKGREVTMALTKALASQNWKRLRQGAERIADAFAAGEQWAAYLVFDRMEGKVGLSEPVGDGILQISWISAPQSQVIEAQPVPDKLEQG
jgi:hypothetical protein